MFMKTIARFDKEVVLYYRLYAPILRINLLIRVTVVGHSLKAFTLQGLAVLK